MAKTTPISGGNGHDIEPAPKWKGKNIFERLLAIEGELGALIKDGRAPASIGDFKFHTHTSVTAAVAPKLQEWNVYMLPSVSSIEETTLDYGQDKYGKQIIMNKSAVKVDIMFRCADMASDNNGQAKDGVVGFAGYGTGLDKQDKSAGKAVSYAIKSALLKALKLDRVAGAGEVDNEADDGLDF